MKAIDLLTGHSMGCAHGVLIPGTGGLRIPCTCRLAERQEAAREIDARVAALERFAAASAVDITDISLIRRARPWVARCTYGDTDAD